MAGKIEQRAFFLSEDGTRLSTHTQKDFHKIKPKEKKVKKPRIKKLTPFKEIIQLERITRQRAKILEEYGASEDMNGNIYMMQKGQMSQIGWDEATEFLKDMKMKRPDLPEIPILSPIAFRLRYALLKQQKERGPQHAPPFTHADKFDFLGNPLKK